MLGTVTRAGEEAWASARPPRALPEGWAGRVAPPPTALWLGAPQGGHPGAVSPPQRVALVPLPQQQPFSQLLPRLWAPPGRGRASTSVRVQGSVLTMRRPSGPGSPAHRAAAAALSSVLPWERISEERRAAHGWAGGLG